MPRGSLSLPPWGGALRPIFTVRFVFRFLEAMQSRQRFLEVRSTLYRHRVGIHQIRTDPPITHDTSLSSFVTIWLWSSLASLSISRMTSSERPNSIIVFLNHVSRINRSWMFRICSFDTSFEVVSPCGILCNLLSSRTCDRVVGPSWCRSLGIEKRSRTDEMYFLFSVVSSRKKCPHVQ